MDLRTSKDSPLPLGVQLAEQIRHAIELGDALPGDPLPTIREVAERADVNVNTVASVYRDLADEGYLVQGRRAGTRVADAPPRQPERTLAAFLAARTSDQAAAAGVGAADVALALLALEGRRTSARSPIRIATLAASPLAATRLASAAAEVFGGAFETVPVTPQTYRSIDYHFTVVAPELGAYLADEYSGGGRSSSPPANAYVAGSIYGPDFPAGAD